MDLPFARIRHFGALFFFALTLSSAVSSQTTIRICYEAQALPPYVLAETEVPEINPGIFVEIVERAVLAAKITPHFYRSSWNRCWADLEAGHADAIFGSLWSEQRDRLARFPKKAGELAAAHRLWRSEYLVFVRNDSMLTWDGQEFGELSFGVGAPFGYLVHQRLEALDALASVSLDVTAGLKLTARNRIDGYVLEQAIGRQLLRQLALEHTLSPLPQAFMQADLYLPFSHRFYQENPKKAQEIWEKISLIRGQYGPMLKNKYAN